MAAEFVTLSQNAWLVTGIDVISGSSLRAHCRRPMLLLIAQRRSFVPVGTAHLTRKKVSVVPPYTGLSRASQSPRQAHLSPTSMMPCKRELEQPNHR